jgi:hypothetical protein
MLRIWNLTKEFWFDQDYLMEIGADCKDEALETDRCVRVLGLLLADMRPRRPGLSDSLLDDHTGVIVLAKSRSVAGSQSGDTF